MPQVSDFAKMIPAVGMGTLDPVSAYRAWEKDLAKWPEGPMRDEKEWEFWISLDKRIRGIDWGKLFFIRREGWNQDVKPDWMKAVADLLFIWEKGVNSLADYKEVQAKFDAAFLERPNFPWANLFYPRSGNYAFQNQTAATYLVPWAIDTRNKLATVINIMEGIPVQKTIIDYTPPVPDVGILVSVPVVDVGTGEVYNAEGSIVRTLEESQKPLTEKDLAIAALNLQPRLPANLALLPKEQGGIDIAKATGMEVPNMVWWIAGGLLGLFALSNLPMFRK